MSKTIWKFPLRLQDRQSIDVPAHHHVLCCQTQEGVPTLWVKVDTDAEMNAHCMVTIVGTGHPVPDDAGDYIDTVQIRSFVWHVFYNHTPTQFTLRAT